LEIDFSGDAPALRNEFRVWLTSSLSEGSSAVDAPDWFPKDTARLMGVNYENATSDQLCIVFCAADYVGQLLCFQRLNAGDQFLSDEAVECIGREDYVRMVACLGQHRADEYFEEKRSASP
jgi:hypothetical protein